jgi:hypothetical protein
MALCAAMIVSMEASSGALNSLTMNRHVPPTI